MTPTKRKGTFNSGVALVVGRESNVEGADCGEDGGFVATVAGVADEPVSASLRRGKQAIFEGVCAAGGI
jgi:hypothetical protein